MNRPKDWYDSCKSCKLEYVLHGLDTLPRFLAVVGEIAAETGMEEWVLTWHGVRLAWNWKDAKAVDAGAMTEDEYMARNVIGLPGK